MLKTIALLPSMLLLASLPMSLSGNTNAQIVSAGRNDSKEIPVNNSYVDLPLEVLQNRIPALRGLTPNAVQNHDMLSLVLAQAGTVIDGLVPKLPDLASSESVHISRSASALLGPFSVREAQLRQSPNKEFNYLLLHHQNSDGSTTLEEYRSDLKNRRVDLSDQKQGFPSSYGFAYCWLLFLPANQVEAKFRYLGQQRIEGHETFVVAFAQNPDQVKIPGQFMLKGKPIPFFYQGVAWVDQSTFLIVMLHTDLLRPLPEVRLTQMTAEIFFQMGHIRGIDLDLWLPREVLISSERDDQSLAELHEYSNYKMYHAKTRIVLPP